MATDRNALHVLMVLESNFPSAVGGGAEAQVGTLAKGLRARGHRVTILTPLLLTGPQQRVCRVDGSAVCRLAYPRLRWLGGLVLWVRLAFFLLRRRRRYDAWHVHIAHHLGAICALLGARLGPPVLVKVSGWWELEQGVLAPKASPVARLAYRCLLRADHWQAISQRIAAALADKGVPAERLLAIPNAVDTRRFDHIVPTGSPYLRFLFLGRLVPEKDLETLLDAFAKLLDRHPEARLRIVGAGPLSATLRQRASGMGLSRQVAFDGHRGDIEAVLAQADFAVLPSRIEGLSNTLLECMAAGLPIIASRVSGSEDLVRDGENGWLFAPGDCSALAACLSEAARLPVLQRLAMGAFARSSVQRYADLDAVLDRLLANYRGTCRSPAPALPANHGSA